MNLFKQLIYIITFILILISYPSVVGSPSATDFKELKPYTARDYGSERLEIVNNREQEQNQWQTFIATAYTPRCEGCSGITYSGYNVRNTKYYKGYRVIAADLDVLPLYSIVEIQYDNNRFKAIVLDKGGAIDGFEVDILMLDLQKALDFGRREAQIKVIRKGRGDEV
jgi:3D (Asp-Asp-Asp) domain-containing protein